MGVTTKLPCMKGGNEETSYAKNSSLQKMVIEVTKPIREQAIMDLLYTTNTNTLHVADLGCSSGPNAFLVVSEVMKMACDISQKLKKDIPDFQMYLNDLPDADFNFLFTSLASFRDAVKDWLGLGSDKCFVNGSQRHSMEGFSLQKVPGGLESDKGNTGMASTSPPRVLKAYYDQFCRDFSLFLKVRSEELVAGGRMVLTFRGRKSDDPASKEGSYIWELLVRGLDQMVAEGIIDKQKFDSFNIPEYTPCPSEVKQVVENNGSFIINSLNLTEIPWAGGANPEKLHDPYYVGSYVAKYIRAVVGPMLASHFGESIINEAFKRHGENLSDCYTREAPNFYNVTVSLTRK